MLHVNQQRPFRNRKRVLPLQGNIGNNLIFTPLKPNPSHCGHLLQLCEDGENPLSPFTSGEGDDIINTKSGIADIIKQLLQLVIFMYSPYLMCISA